MAVWFTTLAIAGFVHLVHYPKVLLALSPNFALAYVGHAGAGTTFAVWVRVFLALTGGGGALCRYGPFRQTGESASTGSRLCCPPLFWFTSAKEPLCWPIRLRSGQRPFSFSFRTGCWFLLFSP